ncbi:MAG: hypothetical protein Q7S92_00595 [Candidatus Diapherotrites archaeon]|nr:hypothetical protein [Candidatus Diapherotrites archaeon]
MELGIGYRPVHPSITYFGLPAKEATQFAQVWTHSLMVERPDISEQDFEKEVIRRIRLMHELHEKLKTNLQRNRVSLYEPFAIDMLTHFFYSMGHMKISFKEKLHSWNFFSRVFPKWINSKPISMGAFSIVRSIFSHPESPLGFEIRDKFGKTIATLGGLVCYLKKRPTLVFRNIQGIKSLLPRKQTSTSVYTELSRALGENWRVALVKATTEFAKERKWNIVGDLPGMFEKGPDALTTRTEYTRYRRQYAQTYRKAGLRKSKKEDRFFWTQPNKRHRVQKQLH